MKEQIIKAEQAGDLETLDTLASLSNGENLNLVNEAIERVKNGVKNTETTNSETKQVVGHGGDVNEINKRTAEIDAKIKAKQEFFNNAIVLEDGEFAKKIETSVEQKESVLNRFAEWKEREVQKIENEAKEMEGQSKSVSISDRPTQAYDKRSRLLALDNYGELKFIEYAINEGDSEDVNDALKRLNASYRDRDDLKNRLLEKSNQN